MIASHDPCEAAGPLDAGAAAADFDEFYSSTARRASALAFALTGNWSDAEDLVQVAYVAAYRDWHRIGSYDDPAAWINRVVTNRSASRWRRLGREVRALARVEARHKPTFLDDSVDPRFWVAVQELPVRQRQVVALFYVADLSVAQIAERLRCSDGTVKSHLSRARIALHESLGNMQEEE